LFSLSVKSVGSRLPDTRHQLYGQAGCPPVSHLIRKRRFRFFGHVGRADPEQDQHRVTGASLRPPSDWRRPCGRPRTSWLRATDTGAQSVYIGIHSAWRKASDLTLLKRIVDTATLHHGVRHRRRKSFWTSEAQIWPTQKRGK